MRQLARTLPRPAIFAAALMLVAAPTAHAQDGLTIRQKSTIDMGQMGGGELSQTVMIHGTDRQKTVTEGRMKILVVSRDASATEIVRLDEGQVYKVDDKRKQAQAQSIAELRREMEKAQRQMESSAAGPDEKEVRTWIESAGLERTGERQTINGFATERAVLRLTVMGENLKTQEKAPVFFLTADTWVDPSQAEAARIMHAFQRAYATALGVDPRASGNPYARWFKDLYEGLEGLEGYPIRMNMVVEGPSDGAASVPNPVAALGGLLRRGSQPKQEPAASASPGRTVLFSMATEVLSLSTDAPAASEFEVPAGYRTR